VVQFCGYLSPSLRFNGHFYWWIWVSQYQNVSPFQILLELKTMELAAKTGARTCAKLHRHHQHTDTQFFTGQMPSLSPNQQEGHLACKKLGVGTLLVTI